MDLRLAVAILAADRDRPFGMDRNPAQDFLTFLLGGALFVAGMFLFLNQVMVATPGGLGGIGRWGGAYRQGIRYGTGGGWGLPDFSGIGGGAGLLMIPLGIGVAMLFMNAYRKTAWFLIWGSAAALVAGIRAIHPPACVFSSLWPRWMVLPLRLLALVLFASPVSGCFALVWASGPARSMHGCVGQGDSLPSERFLSRRVGARMERVCSIAGARRVVMSLACMAAV